MRINALYAILGMVGLSAVAVAACSSTTTVNNGTTDDAGTTTDDSSTEADSGSTGSDTGTGADTATSTTDGGDAGVVCDIPDGSDACDTCALTSCCSEENTCQSEALNDAGTTDCESLFQCVQDCLAPAADSGVDGGSFSDCSTTCSAAYETDASPATADFNALATCLTNSCASSCN